jgi:hypothetical protein
LLNPGEKHKDLLLHLAGLCAFLHYFPEGGFEPLAFYWNIFRNNYRVMLPNPVPQGRSYYVLLINRISTITGNLDFV